MTTSIFSKKEKSNSIISEIEEKYSLLEWMKIIFWIQVIELVGVTFLIVESIIK